MWKRSVRSSSCLAHSSHVLGFKWNSTVFIEPDRERSARKTWAEERRGKDRGGGHKATGRWRWAWQKQWARTKQDENAIKRVHPSTPYAAFFKQCWARHVPQDCPRGFENGLYGARSPANFLCVLFPYVKVCSHRVQASGVHKNKWKEHR